MIFKGHRNTIFAIIWLVAVLILIQSCNSYRRKYIIPERKFVEVLIDMQVANALMRQQLAMALQTNVDSASLYGSLFEKHNLIQPWYIMPPGQRNCRIFTIKSPHALRSWNRIKWKICNYHLTACGNISI